MMKITMPMMEITMLMMKANDDYDDYDENNYANDDYDKDEDEKDYEKKSNILGDDGRGSVEEETICGSQSAMD